MSGCEQLSMFTMSIEPTTAICCFGRGLASATPIETWMADLVPNGEYVVHVAGYPLVLRPTEITQKAIPKGDKLYAGIFVGRGGDMDG